MMRRKQYEAFSRMVLKPDDWCAILGVRMLDPDGWRRLDCDWDEPVPLSVFVVRCFSSTLAFEDGATDFFDVENYAAEDECGNRQVR